MAKLSDPEFAALKIGYGAAQSGNPFLFSSSTWEAFEIGRYMANSGLALEPVQRRRGTRFDIGAGHPVHIAFGRHGAFTIKREG